MAVVGEIELGIDIESVVVWPAQMKRDNKYEPAEKEIRVIHRQ